MTDTSSEPQLTSELAFDGEKGQFVFRLPGAELKMTYSDAESMYALVDNLPSLIFDMFMAKVDGTAEEVPLGDVEYSSAAAS